MDIKNIYFYKLLFTLKHYQLMWTENIKHKINIFVSLRKLALSRNLSTNLIWIGYLFIGMDFDTMIYLCLKPRLLMKNVDFSNRQRLKVSLT